MKYVLVIGDGMSDDPIAELNHKTPLEYLDLPAFGVLAGSEVGACQTVPEGVPAGSDTAILNIFGYDPRWSYTGRSVLEAAGVGVTLKKGEVSMRVNLCAVEEMDGKLIIHSHNGGNIEGDEAETLMNDLLKDPRFIPAAQKAKLTVHVSRTFRHIGVFSDVDETAVFKTTEPHNVLEQDVALYYPTGAMKEEITALMQASYEVLKDHPINKARIAQGKLPANMIWPWGAGRAMLLDNFTEKYVTFFENGLNVLNLENGLVNTYQLPGYAKFMSCYMDYAFICLEKGIYRINLSSGETEMLFSDFDECHLIHAISDECAIIVCYENVDSLFGFSVKTYAVSSNGSIKELFTI